MRRGFALIEVLVAFALIAAVGTGVVISMNRAAQTNRTAESSEAAAALIHAATLSLRSGIPVWLPQNNGQTIQLTPDQIRNLLNLTPNRTYADPDLYREVSITRTDSGTNREYLMRVCLRIANEEIPCPEQRFILPVAATPYVPPGNPTRVNPPAPVQGQLQLVITGPPGSFPDTTLLANASAQETYNAYGTYNKTLPPGSYQIRSAPTATSLYSYSPDVTNATVNIAAGRGSSVRVAYICQSGAANIRVIRPDGVAHPAGNVSLRNNPVPEGGVVPYMMPGPARLEAQNIVTATYTYRPNFSPGQNLSIAACATTNATVSYIAITGALQVTVGKPGHVSSRPGISIEGPENAFQEGTSLLFADLTPGNYNITPRDILENGIRYRGTASSNPATVDPGETARVNVTYTAVSARLNLAVSVPMSSGRPVLSPNISVSGPNGYNQQITVSGAHHLDDLEPGVYTITVNNVQAGDYLYGASPASRSITLAAGQSGEMEIAYGPLTGAATINVTGLPDPSLINKVRFNGTPLAQSPSRFLNLAPGNYRLEAEAFTWNGYGYAPDASSRGVQVNAGETSSLTVTYSRQEGTIVYRVSGLPAGQQGALSLTTPSGATANFSLPNGESRQSGLPTGSYTLTAQDLVYNGITYRPTVNPSTVTLNNGGSAEFTITYAAINGRLAVAVTGLPDGVAAPIRVSATGYDTIHNVTGSAQITLPPGSYTVAGQPITRTESTPYGPLTYTYTPGPAQTVTIREGQDSSATVTYSKNQGDLNYRVQLPAGAGATITLTGPGGFNQTFTASSSNNARSYTNVPTGVYRATAPEIVQGGITYRAAEATATVSANQTQNLESVYVAATGVLEVEVSNLPNGLTPTLYLRQGSTNQERTGRTARFENLAPGQYTLFGSVEYDGDGWAWTAEAQTLNIQAGQVSRTSLAYVKQTGHVRLAVSGLPEGCGGSLSLNGPRNPTLPISAAGGVYEVGVGSYTASTGDILCNGYTYRPTVSPNAFQINPGGDQTISIVYTGQFGTVTFQITGLPNGAQTTLSANGPQSLSATRGNGSYAMQLAPGSYTFSASSVSTPSYTYSATLTPATGTVAVGGNSTVDVAFAPVDGALQLTITGPAGMPNPSVQVTGGSYNTLLTTPGSHTLPHLAPGSYSIQPNAVRDANGNVYMAASQNVNITAGNTASATVTYVKQTAQLTVTISGLPAGTTSTITLSGPTARSVSSGNGSITLSDLPLGTYTLAGSKVVFGGYGYTAASRTVTMNTPGSYNATLTFSVATGRLRVTTTGLPSWKTPSYSVSGPASYTVDRTNQSFDDVPPGTYTSNAPTFDQSDPTEGGAVYRFTPNNISVGVNAGGASSMVVNYQVTGTIKVVINSSQPITPDVQVYGNNLRSLGTHYLNYVTPGSYGLTARPVSYYGINFTPSPSSTSLTVQPGSITTVVITYVPENKAAFNITVRRVGGTTQGEFWDATVPATQFITGGTPVVTAYLGFTSRAVDANPPWAPYFTNPAVGSRVEFLSYCGWYGCHTRFYWRLDSLTGLPPVAMPGQVYNITVTYVAHKCYQNFLNWTCQDIP